VPSSARKTPARKTNRPIKTRRLKKAVCEADFFFIELDATWADPTIKTILIFCPCSLISLVVLGMRYCFYLKARKGVKTFIVKPWKSRKLQWGQCFCHPERSRAELKDLTVDGQRRRLQALQCQKKRAFVNLVTFTPRGARRLGRGRARQARPQSSA
jgi:hypothetical protein